MKKGLKKKSIVFKWLKIKIFLPEKNARDKTLKSLKVLWILPKKSIPLSVTRNRLKRKAREKLKKADIKGLVQLSFLPFKEKTFYKTLKQEDFELVFKKALEKLKQVQSSNRGSNQSSNRAKIKQGIKPRN